MATAANSNQLTALTTFMESYLECVETLPDDVQRSVSQLRELDLLYRAKLSQISQLLDLYSTEKDPSTRRKYLTKIQRCLVRSQEYGDEKLQLVSQINDMGENRNHQIARVAEEMDAPTRMDDSPAIRKTDNHGIHFEDIRGERASKRPRRQRNFDKFETLANVAKAESSTKREKKVKEEKTTKAEKKEKAADKAEVSETAATHSTSTTETPKKSADTSKKGNDSAKKKAKEGKKEAKKKKPGKKKKKEKETAPDDIPIDPDEPTYCLCNQGEKGEKKKIRAKKSSLFNSYHKPRSDVENRLREYRF